MRKLRPRATSTLCILPATVTDRTCAVVLGLDPPTFRPFLKSQGIPHVHIGRRVIARVDDVLAAISRLSEARAPADGAPASETSSKNAAELELEVLEQLGLRPRRAAAGG